MTLPLLAGRTAARHADPLRRSDGRTRRGRPRALAEEVARRLAIALENALLYERAEEAVRARDEFLAVASHELKTPLTPLRIRIQTIERLVARGELGNVPREKLLQLFGGRRGAGAADRGPHRRPARRDPHHHAAAEAPARAMDLVASVRAVVERHARRARRRRAARSASTRPTR